MSVSIVIPLYNERENVGPLYERLEGVLSGIGQTWEIVFVDDGSTDGTDRELEGLARADRRVRVVQLRRNFGQTAAIKAGIGEARGDVIVTMDGDLQNDPADVPMMLDKLDEGYDVVHGWRKDRKDPWLSRRVPSQIANWLISRTTGFAVHDLGCTLKAIRRPIARELELYGEMHRFIPILADWQGARCAEVVTRHHPRRHGKSKYGIGRTARVVLDLITVKFMLDYFASPMKLFGMIGLGCGFLSGLAGTATILMKLLGGVDMTGNPLLLGSVFAALVAMQFLSLGLLGEFSTRIYYGRDGRQNYAVRRLVNFDADDLTDGPGRDEALAPGRRLDEEGPQRLVA
jgi:glycosyltransferase involved in cell wall biosynthesis